LEHPVFCKRLILGRIVQIIVTAPN
jgi:hypothetical protein